MKKNKIILYIILALVFLGLFVFVITRKQKPFNKLDIPITNFVTNRTTSDFVTPIINAGLYQLNIDSMYVIVRPMSLVMKTNGIGDNDYEIMGTLIGNRTQFIMYLDNINRNEAIKIIAHELIHLEQYHTGRLTKMEIPNHVLWEGKIYDMLIIPYKERPWEIEAYEKDSRLARKIHDMLLN